MKDRRTQPFYRRLYAAFLFATLVPLLLSSLLLFQFFRLRLDSSVAERTAEQLENVTGSVEAAVGGFRRAAALTASDALTCEALRESRKADPQVYSALYGSTEGLRDYARFDLYDNSGKWLYSTRESPAEPRLPTDWGILGAAGLKNGEPVYMATGASPDSSRILYQGAAALIGPDGHRAGFFVFSMSREHFASLTDGKYSQQDDLLVLSRFWRPVYCSRPSAAVPMARMLRASRLNGTPPGDADSEFLYQAAEEPDSGLSFVLRHPRVFSRAALRVMYTVSASFAVVCVALSVIVSDKLSRQMYRPIGRVQKAFGEVEKNDLSVRLPQEPGDELPGLSRGFNAMVSALGRNQEELLANQKELNEAQIRMLQAQLNPHFIYNTLDTMKWISKINKVPQVAAMSADLADLLRYCISPAEFVTLREETGILQRYIEIQKIRLSDTFSFTLDVPEELMDCVVPKMILQPLAENAIIHGLPGVENASLTVSARLTGAGLSITVSDNGRGLPEGMRGPYPAAAEHAGEHLGLHNVSTILRKHYGEEYGLVLENGPDGTGASVTALLPAERKETENAESPDS